MKFQIIIVYAILFSNIFSQLNRSDLSQEQIKLYDEHVFGDQPDNDTVLIRNGYVISYNNDFRIPNWVAYHITPEYLQTPKRKGKWASYRKDKDLHNAVVSNDYKFQGYDRGHLAPYAIMGGDRDDDGLLAEDDDYDKLTVYQANYMSNMSPQHARAINGAGGLWYKLEEWVRDSLVSNYNDIWIYAGTIIVESAESEFIGPDDDIAVPDLFYKMIIKDDGNQFPSVLVFLFPHYRDKEDINESSIFKYLVSVDYIESLSGLDFFSSKSPVLQDDNESIIDLNSWKKHFNK
ncbi:MAG: DNA/RNA non-specific endonuclease [Bacteroidota bacterium]